MTVVVFDPKIWGGKDCGTNAHCYREAELLCTYRDPRDGALLADVRFLHDGRTSRGHFVEFMRPPRSSASDDETP